MSGALREELGSFTLDELLGWDLGVGVVVGCAAAWGAATNIDQLNRALPYAVGFVAMVIGAVITGSAIVAATMDQAFLRKLRLIGRSPARYVAPFMFTAVIGSVSALALTVLAAVEHGPTVVTVPLAALAYGGATWTVFSLLANLNTLVQYLRLMSEAADISDDSVSRLESGQVESGSG